MINFGRYNSVIEFYKAITTKDEFNDVITELQRFTSKRSRVLNKSSTTTTDNTPNTVTVIEAKIRYSNDITNDLTLRYNNTNYTIVSVVDYDGSKRELIITAIKA